MEIPLPQAARAFLLLTFFTLAGCSTPSGEYGGVYYEDNSGPGLISNGPVMTSEQVGTGIGPWGGIYNYEEVNFGPPSS